MSTKKNIVYSLFLLLVFGSWGLKENGNNNVNNYAEILREADEHLGGLIPGIGWDINLDNFEDDKIKNQLNLVVDAYTSSTQKFALITFRGPKKFEGQKLLIRDNNMWFTKRGLNQPLPISGRQRLTGSAANADVASANYTLDYNIEGVTDDKFNNEPCYLYNLTAKNSLVSYSRIKVFVSKKSNLVLRSEFYAKSSDKMIKYALFEYAQQAAYKGKRMAFVSRMSIFDNVDLSNRTVLNISGIRFQNYELSRFEKNNL
jgi:hypothetical protein